MLAGKPTRIAVIGIRCVANNQMSMAAGAPVPDELQGQGIPLWIVMELVGARKN